jgi:hypothetical protein
MSSLCSFGSACESFDKSTAAAGATYGFHICNRCLAHYVGDISALLFDYLDLSQIIARRDGHSESKISRPKPASVPPIDLNVDAARSAIAEALGLVEMDLRTATGTRPRYTLHARSGYNVQQAVAFIAPRVDTLAGLQDLPSWSDAYDHEDATGVSALTDLSRLHRRARRMCGLSELTIALPGYCEKCHVAALSRRDGSDTVHCGSCGFAQPWDAYRKRVTLRVTEINSDGP